MAYPRHWLLVIGGTLNVSAAQTYNEEWQVGIRGVPGVSADYGQEDAVLENISPQVEAWFAAAENHMSATARLTYLKLNEIAPDGSYAQPVSHTHNTTATNGGQVQGIPGILNTAFSWTTSASRGYAHLGRIYPPAAFSARSHMNLFDTEQTAFAAAAIRLIEVVGAYPVTDPQTDRLGLAARVVSRGGPSNGNTGVIRTVTGVRIGSVIDVQRRRKNQLPESYVSQDLPA